MDTENIVTDNGQVQTCYIFSSFGDLYLSSIKSEPLLLDEFHRYCDRRLQSDQWNGEYNQSDMYYWWETKLESYLHSLEAEGIVDFKFPEVFKKPKEWHLDTPELFTLVFRMFPEYFPSTARYEDIERR